MNKENFKQKYEIRLEKYQDKIEEKPHLRNQLMIKEGKAILILEGEKYRCEKVEGYIKLSQEIHIKKIIDKDIILSFLPKERMIISCDEQWYFRGYKEENSKDFILILYAASNMYNILVVDTEESLTPLIMIDLEEVGDGANENAYRQFENIINKLGIEEIGVSDSEIKVQEDKDEWE